MSHFAGIFSLAGQKGPPAALANALALGFASMGGSISTFTGKSLVLFHADYIDGRDPGWLAPRGASGPLALAGDLILAGGAFRPSGRLAELEVMGSALKCEDPRDAIQLACGTFALCSFHPEPARLVLATDSLGARPLFWMIDGDLLIFSTSFRLLASLPVRKLEVNWPAVAEQAAFCYPLGSRTVLEGVNVLRDGELIVAQKDGWKLHRYHKWEATSLVHATTQDHCANLYTVFLRALADRCAPGGTIQALLSGGLDSRAVIGGLLDIGHSVEAVNCALDGWQDCTFAAEFAARAGVPVRRVPWSQETLGLTPGRTTAGLLLHITKHCSSPEVFSGDGGGETVGFLMMAPAIMALMQAGRNEEAVRAYTKHDPVSRWILRPDVTRRLQDAPLRGMASEIAAMPSVPPQKAMQLFLLRNDMRCHLHETFEESEKHSSELMLPFYDKRMLESMIRIAPPLDALLSHQFYYEWILLFKSPVASVPWQAYPSHLPCPLPIPVGTISQWDGVKPWLATRARRWRGQALRLVLRNRASCSCLSPARLLLVAMASILGLTSSTHHFREFLWISAVCRIARSPKAISSKSELVSTEGTGAA